MPTTATACPEQPVPARSSATEGVWSSALKAKLGRTSQVGKGIQAMGYNLQGAPFRRAAASEGPGGGGPARFLTRSLLSLPAGRSSNASPTQSRGYPYPGSKLLEAFHLDSPSWTANPLLD